MLKNRHQPVNLFALVPQLGLNFEPQLQQLDRLLDDDELMDLVRGDLAKRYPKTRSRGRPSTPVEVILRMLVVMRLYSWSYAQTEFFVADSLVLRQFCRVYLEKVPDDTTLIRWANTIGPETIEQINGRVVQLARSLKVTRGRKLRIDTTAVETNIHFPTDSGLIGDGVRVVSRLLRRAKAALGEAATTMGEAFRSRVRAVRKLSQQLHRIARRKNQAGREALQAAYGRLVATAKRAGAQGRRVLDALQEQSKDPEGQAAGRTPGRGPAAAEAGHSSGRAAGAGGQPGPLGREVGVAVRAAHAGDPALQGGRARWSSAARSGSTRSRAGSSAATGCWSEGAARTSRACRRAWPTTRSSSAGLLDLLAGDRGVSSAENERLAKEAGVKNVALPHVGKAPPERLALEKGRRFRQGYRFRAGIEGGSMR